MNPSRPPTPYYQLNNIGLSSIWWQQGWEREYSEFKTMENVTRTYRFQEDFTLQRNCEEP